LADTAHTSTGSVQEQTRLNPPYVLSILIQTIHATRPQQCLYRFPDPHGQLTET